jgi:hypothetical protein
MRIYQKERFIEFLPCEPTDKNSFDRVILSSDSLRAEKWWRIFNEYPDIARMAVIDQGMQPETTRVGITRNRKLLSLSRAFDDFTRLFRFVPAAGGLVRNSGGQLLFIYRLGYWDLPKGKIERSDFYGVDVERAILNASVRETGEETSIRSLAWIRELPSTWHLFQKKGEWVLKETFWYEFVAQGDEMPEHQVDEGITEARWVNHEKLAEVISCTYPSLCHLLGKVL